MAVSVIHQSKLVTIIISIQFSCSVVYNSLWPHEPQHARPPCPSPTLGVYLNSHLFSQWCHPTVSSSVIPFSFCPQSFPASGSFQMSQLFSSDGQRIGVSASTLFLSMNTQDIYINVCVCVCVYLPSWVFPHFPSFQVVTELQSRLPVLYSSFHPSSYPFYTG